MNWIKYPYKIEKSYKRITFTGKLTFLFLVFNENQWNEAESLHNKLRLPSIRTETDGPQGENYGGEIESKLTTTRQINANKKRKFTHTVI